MGRGDGVGPRVGDLTAVGVGASGEDVALGVGVSGRVVAAAVVRIGVTVTGGGDATVSVGEPPEQAAPTVASNASRLAVKNMRKCLVTNRRCITTGLYEIPTGGGSLGLERAEYSTAYAK